MAHFKYYEDDYERAVLELLERTAAGSISAAMISIGKRTILSCWMTFGSISAGSMAIFLRTSCTR